jgi:tRNA (guanine-N7-)-methyltransferase
MDWSKHFPAFVNDDGGGGDTSAPRPPGSPAPMKKQVEIADIGCGFGGLLVALSPLFPDTLMIGSSPLSPTSTIYNTRPPNQ